MSQTTQENFTALISQIETVDDFSDFVKKIETRNGYAQSEVFAIGIATLEDDEILEVLYPCINLDTNHGTAALLFPFSKERKGNTTHPLTSNDLELLNRGFKPFYNDGKDHPNIDIIRDMRTSSKFLNQKRTQIVVTFIEDLSLPPTSTADMYLRLQLISHRLVKPNEINIENIFTYLPNIAWTSDGPMSPTQANKALTRSRLEQKYLQVFSVDKFPRMTDYIVPSKVRIADSIRVRLGAYIGEGVTFMHEGFCNFNAGAEGPNMIEGRISAGVYVHRDSDLGGGSASMGTLSGGGKERIEIGIGCLLGSNSVLGISLGDFCTLEAGLALTAGAKVLVYDKNDPKGTKSSPVISKALELSGKSGILFRRSSTDGCIEALYQKNEVELNEMLHSKQ